jgi:hypothetical protein
MMRKVRLFVPIVAFVFCLSNTGNAEDSGYWSIELPVPDSATNVATNVDRQFLVKSVSFDWEGEDTAALREFYGTYFESIGWEDFLAGSSGFSDLRAPGWSSYSMNFTEQNRPVVKFGTMWKATAYPAFGTVMIQLDAFELHTIALPANYREESDPLLAEYYQIVDEIILEYRKWGREYVSD